MLETLLPLTFTIAGITAYALFVFRFYRFLARRDMFAFDDSRHPILRTALSVIFYMLLYPVCVFVWFAVIAALLYLLSSEQPDTIMLTAMGVVGAVRVCSYLSEALATDIARIVPFGLLSFMLLDTSLALRDLEDSVGYAESLVENFTLVQIETLAYYLIAVIALEFALRLLSMAWRRDRSD